MQDDKAAAVYRCFNLHSLEEGYAITYKDKLPKNIEPLEEPVYTFSVNELRKLGLEEGIDLKRLCTLSAAMKTTIFVSDQDLSSSNLLRQQVHTLTMRGKKSNENFSVILTDRISI